MSLLLAACAGPSYYAQAISGHLGLMSARQDATELMSSSGDPELVRHLQVAADIRSFAVERLGLPDNGSYTKFVRTGREAVSWNVVAAPEFSVEAKEWCFPVSGCVPYRGYFQRGRADKFAGQMAKVELATPLDGRRRFKGILDGFEDDHVLLAVPGDVNEDGEELNTYIPIELIADAKLVVADDLVKSVDKQKGKARPRR